MFKVSALIHLAGIAGTRLLGPYFFPPHLTGVSLPRFTTESPYRAVARCWSTDYDSFMVHVIWCSTTFSSCSLRILEQRVSGTLDRPRWTNSMVCSFPCLKSPILLPQVTSTVYCLYYSSQWREALAVTHAEWISDDPHDDWNFPAVRQSPFRHARSCVETQCGPFENFHSSSGGRNSENMINNLS